MSRNDIVTRIVVNIRANALDWHRGVIPYEVFSMVNRALWKSAAVLGLEERVDVALCFPYGIFGDR